MLVKQPRLNKPKLSSIESTSWVTELPVTTMLEGPLGMFTMTLTCNKFPDSMQTAHSKSSRPMASSSLYDLLPAYPHKTGIAGLEKNQ
jgi:hypothetical protein